MLVHGSVSKRRMPVSALLVTLLGCAISAAGQSSSHNSSSGTPSLGDLARKQRQKQPAKDAQAKPKKVVTNEDLPEHPEASSDTASSSSSAPNASSPDDGSAPAGAVLQAGDQLKAAILKQKTAVADLKSQIDKLQGSIHFVEANAYRNGVEYNKSQAQKQQEVQRLQGQLDEQKKNLEQMQETARKAGFGSSVWDP